MRLTTRGDAGHHRRAFADRDVREHVAQQRGGDRDGVHPLKDARPRGRWVTNMDRGLYLAASGMLAEQLRQDQIANDLAECVDGRLQGRAHDAAVVRADASHQLRHRPVDRQRDHGRRGTNTVTDWTAAAAEGHGRAAGLRDQRRRLLRRQDRRGHALHAQRPVHRRRRWPADDAARAIPSSAATTSRSSSATTARSIPRLLNVVLLNNPEKEGNNYITGTPGTVAGQTAGQVRSGCARGLRRRSRLSPWWT